MGVARRSGERVEQRAGRLVGGPQHLGVGLDGERLPRRLDDCVDVEGILRDAVGVLVQALLRGEDAREGRGGGG